MDKIAKALWNFIEKIAHGVLGAVFHVIGRELPDEVFASFMQFVKFGIVGASNTLISYLTYVIGISVGYIIWRQVFWDLSLASFIHFTGTINMFLLLTIRRKEIYGKAFAGRLLPMQGQAWF